MSLEKLMIRRMNDLGVIREKMVQLMHHELFNDLSKHNEFWSSKDEVADNKLYETRCQLNFIEDKMNEILGILNPDYMEIPEE